MGEPASAHKGPASHDDLDIARVVAGRGRRHERIRLEGAHRGRRGGGVQCGIHGGGGEYAMVIQEPTAMAKELPRPQQAQQVHGQWSCWPSRCPAAPCPNEANVNNALLGRRSAASRAWHAAVGAVVARRESGRHGDSGMARLVRRDAIGTVCGEMGKQRKRGTRPCCILEASANIPLLLATNSVGVM